MLNCNWRKISLVVVVVISLIGTVGCSDGLFKSDDSSGTNNFTLTVKLRDKNTDSEVKGQVEVLQGGSKVKAKTGKNLQFDLSEGDYKVKVDTVAYAAKTVSTSVTEDFTTKIELAKDFSNNLAGNGQFEKALSDAQPDSNGNLDTQGSWSLFLNNGAAAGSISIEQEAAKIEITDTGPNPYSAQLLQAPITLKKENKYKVVFDAKADKKGVKLTTKLGGTAGVGWTAYVQGKKELTTNWKTYTIDLTMQQDTDKKARFEFWFLNNAIYQIDNVQLVKTGEIDIPEPGDKTEADENKVENWELIKEYSFNNKISNDWTFEVGNGDDKGIPGWGNDELQYYTKGDNAKIKDGKLVITAREEQKTDEYGTYNYTSTRMITKNNFSTKYGRIEVKAKLPEGQGIWPAIWMLGSDIDENPWPDCGEIDIMELVGDKPSTVHGTLHGPVSGGAGVGSGYTLDSGKFSDAYHTFALEWDEDELEFYVDDTLYHVANKYEIGEEDWVFDHPHFLILNLAVGGTWPGDPDDTTQFPQTMKIDHIKIYEDTNSESINGEEVWDSEYEKNWEEPIENEFTKEEVVNGDFTSSIVNDQENYPDNWFVWNGEGGSYSSTGVENEQLKLNIGSLGSAAWHLQLAQQMKLVPGTTYQVSFDAKAAEARDIVAKVLNPNNYTSYENATKNLTTTMTTYTMEVKVPSDAAEILQLQFELGKISDASKATTIYFDNVSIKEVTQ